MKKLHTTPYWKKPKEHDLHLIEKKQYPIFTINDNLFSFLITVVIFVLCFTIILSIPYLHVASNFGIPIKPSVNNTPSQSSEKSELHGHDDSDLPTVPFLVTKAGPITVHKYPTGDIISMGFSGVNIVKLNSIDGKHPITPADKIGATSIVAIEKPSVTLDKSSYAWNDKVYISFIDPFSVKYSDRIETIGGNHNIVMSIGSGTKLDCIFRETGYGTGFYSGMITLKWPFIHNDISTNGLTCTVIQNDKTVNLQKSSISISYEYGSNEYAIATSPIEMGSPDLQ